MKQIAGHVSQISLACLKAQPRRAVSAAQETEASCSSCSTKELGVFSGACQAVGQDPVTIRSS